MPKIEFDNVIYTSAKRERKTLIDYLTDKDGCVISNIDDPEGQFFVGVSRNGISVLTLIPAKVLAEYEGDCNRYFSVEEYISECEGGQL